jgi:Recombination endonuclease VII
MQPGACRAGLHPSTLPRVSSGRFSRLNDYEADVARLYRDGMSAAAIGEMYQVSASAVLRALARWGVEVRPSWAGSAQARARRPRCGRQMKRGACVLPLGHSWHCHPAYDLTAQRRRCLGCGQPMNGVEVLRSWCWRPSCAHLASRAMRLQQKYGVSVDAYAAMLTAQQGHCYACPRRAEDEPTGVLSVHHDHLTGFTVALLCSSCNLASGLAGGDDPKVLQALADLARSARTQRDKERTPHSGR